jgi:hypothetical protein
MLDEGFEELLPPAGVNLMAFDNKLSTICRSRMRSPLMTQESSVICARNCNCTQFAVAAFVTLADQLEIRSESAILCSSRAALHTSRAASAFIAAIPSPTMRSGHAEDV